MKKQPALHLGSWGPLDGREGGPLLRLPPEHLVTHGVVVGMTGSGETGLLGSEHADGVSAPELARTIQRLAQRWFIVRNAHVASALILLQRRHALSWSRGSMTRHELRRALGEEPPDSVERVVAPEPVAVG